MQRQKSFCEQCKNRSLIAVNKCSKLSGFRLARRLQDRRYGKNGNYGMRRNGAEMANGRLADGKGGSNSDPFSLRSFGATGHSTSN